jgi:hypothetical protein
MSARRRLVAAVLVVVLGSLFVVRHALLLRAGVWLANLRAADQLEPADRVTFDVPSGWTPIIRTDMGDAWKNIGRTGAKVQ